MAKAMWTCLAKAWQGTLVDMEKIAWQCWASWRALPEFDAKQAFTVLDLDFAQSRT